MAAGMSRGGKARGFRWGWMGVGSKSSSGFEAYRSWLKMVKSRGS